MTLKEAQKCAEIKKPVFYDGSPYVRIGALGIRYENERICPFIELVDRNNNRICVKPSLVTEEWRPDNAED